MSRIRSRGNAATELRFITVLKSAKITGWRRNCRLPGKPDFIFPKFRLAVFIDGCFWHGCPEHGRVPKANNEWWRWKLDRNHARDLDTDLQLRHLGWTVLRLWEHVDPVEGADTVELILDGSVRPPVAGG